MKPNQAIVNKNFSNHNGTLHKDVVVVIDEKKDNDLFRVIDPLGCRWLISKDYLNFDDEKN